MKTLTEKARLSSNEFFGRFYVDFVKFLAFWLLISLYLSFFRNITHFLLFST